MKKITIELRSCFDKEELFAKFETTPEMATIIQNTLSKETSTFVYENQAYGCKVQELRFSLNETDLMVEEENHVLSFFVYKTNTKLD